MTRRTLANAFQPAREVEDPHRFAGRRQQIAEIVDAMHVDGSVTLIYGQRGLGKSSLGLQTSRIAQGDIELLTEFELTHLKLESNQYFITFHVTCTDAIQSVVDLLQLLINAVESIEFSALDGDTSSGRLVDRSTRRRITLKIVEFESTRHFTTESGRSNYQDLNREEKLVQLSELLTRYYGQPVLFVIDELDRLRDSTGLSAFLKAASSPSLKFVLIGIAANHSELLADHQSLSRRLRPVHVTAMTDSELQDIVTRVEEYLHENGEVASFSDPAKRKLARIASGFPWFVHVVGQAALLSAVDADDVEVGVSHVSRALDDLVHDRFAQEYADKYQTAVRDSLPREKLLRLFACWTDSDIPTSEIYPLAQQLGVGNPSVYRGHLASEPYGEVLYSPVFQQRRLVRFRDEMFKIYVQLRPSIYQGVKDEVNDAFGRL